MEKRDKITLVIAAFFFIFLYCTLTTPPGLQDPDIYTHPIPEGCLVYAAAFQASLNARARLDDRSYWSDILAIKFKDAELYHAVLIFEYNNGTWIYDCNKGSFNLSLKRLSDEHMIANLAYPEAEIEDVKWLRSVLDHHDKPEDE